MISWLDWFRGKQFALRGVWFHAAAERLNSIDEFIDIFEMLMHRGVTQIGDLIDAAQFLEHLRADGGRLHFAAARFELVDDVVHDLFQE